jgi:uridine kinase
MLLGNPELAKVYQMELSIGTGYTIYLVPLVYLVMLYLTWRVRRLNFLLFQASIGIAFLLVVLMTPASPGWLLWSLPFLVMYQASSDRIAILLVGLFSGLYTLSIFLSAPIKFAGAQEVNLATFFSFQGSVLGQAASLLHTAMVAVGLILIIKIWREAITRNDFFRLSRKPFILGIAGDSGAGKDTLADAIAGLFGGHSVVKLRGDDYHLWDRQKPIWQVMTQLNPMANDLEGYCNDLISLTDGKSILSRYYDHKTGKRSKPFRIISNDFIIASGLHSLYLPMIRECCNLMIFLDIDEKLRRYFALKRDVNQRGHTVDVVQGSFENRESDSERFIRPQSTHADLILSLKPIHPRMLEDADENHPPRLKLVVGIRNGFNELSTHRVLVGICGLHVDVVVGNNASDVELTVEGDASAEDIAMAASILCPRIIEFLDINPKWHDGMLGLMQLITLSHVSHTLTKRFIA